MKLIYGLLAGAFLCLLVQGAHATLAEQVAAMQPGTWAKVTTTNTAASIDPEKDSAANPAYPNSAPWRASTGFKGLFGAWNSGALAPTFGACGSLAFVGGGHGDYFGNEVVALDLCGPTWKRLSNPYAGPFIWPLPDGAFVNGTPSVPHTYDRVVVAGDKLVMLGAAYNSITANDAPAAWVFDLVTKQWAGPIQHKGSMEGVSAYDTKRGLVWFQPAASRPGEITSLNVTTGEVKYYGLPKMGVLDAMMGYDPVRDRLVMTNFRGEATIAEMDPAKPIWVKVSYAGKPTMNGQHVMAWSAQRQAWIVWRQELGASVYEMKYTGTGYTFTLLTTDPAVSPPANSDPGPFEKFQVTTVGGNEVLIGLQRLQDGVYAFRIPVAPTAAPAAPISAPCIPADSKPLIHFCEASAPPVVPPAATICDLPGVFVCDTFTEARPGTLNRGFAMPAVTRGELVMQIPSNTGADAGGNYTVTFPPLGAFVALSYRVKADAPALAAATSGRKEFILWRGSSSCTDLQLAQTHLYKTPVVSLYTDCGAFSPTITLDGDFLLHYPDYHCLYSDYSRKGVFDRCAITHPDKWEQFYIEVERPSRITAWHRTEGGPWKRYIDTDTYTFHGEGGFDHFMLTAYETGKDPAFTHAPGEVRFDDLVLSTQPFRAALNIL